MVKRFFKKTWIDRGERMTEYIHLTGAEDVRSAGSSMVSAAETIQRAASYIEDSLSRHQ